MLFLNSLLNARTVPVSSAWSAMIFSLVPPLKIPTVTTSALNGLLIRLGMVCNAWIAAAPAIIASFPSWGALPWLDFPWILMVKRSLQAIRSPDSKFTFPAGTADQICIPKMASTPSRAPLFTYSSDFLPISSAIWKISFTVPWISSLWALKIFAAPNNIEVWQSCPQACITPGFKLQ